MLLKIITTIDIYEEIKFLKLFNPAINSLSEAELFEVSKNSILMRLVSIGNDEYLSIMEYDEIDKTGDDEISGVEWLDSIDHMLEFFGESRTDACSGLVLASYN